MGNMVKVAISLVVAVVGSWMTSATIIKGVVLYHLYIVHHYIPPGDEYKPTLSHYIVMAAMLGSLVLSPIIFCFCYHFLGLKNRTPKD